MTHPTKPSLPAFSHGQAIVPLRTASQVQCRVPGSKSLTQRLLLLAALGRGSTRIEGALISEDINHFLGCLRALGFVFSLNGSDLLMQGSNGTIPNRSATLQVGGSGFLARLLPTFLSLKPGGRYRIESSDQMQARPMAPALEPLIQAGVGKAIYLKKAGHLPFIWEPVGLKGRRISLYCNETSQVVSALLLIHPFCQEPFFIDLKEPIVSRSYIRLTLESLKKASYAIDLEAYAPALKGVSPDYAASKDLSATHAEPAFPHRTWSVEPDSSSATYWMNLAISTRSSIHIQGIHQNSAQADHAYLSILERLGLRLLYDASGLWLYPPRKNAQTTQQQFLGPREGLELDFTDFPDSFLSLAAMAPFFKGPLLIRGIGHTRGKESDRIQAAAFNLSQLGQSVQVTPNSLQIQPQALRPAHIDTFMDHRVLMSFATLGSYDFYGNQAPWLYVNDVECCAKSFPGFFQDGPIRFAEDS